jgi:hypothetical protein
MLQVARKAFFATFAQHIQDQRIYPRRACRHMSKSNDIIVALPVFIKQM